MAFLLADRRGFLTKAWRTCSMFSGVLTEGSLPGEFLFATDAVSLKFLTHNSRILWLGTLSFQWMSKCRRNIRSVGTTESFFKYVSKAKARCSTEQRSMATEMLWVPLEGCSKTNSPRQQFHSELCCQIVRYFCRTLYYWLYTYNEVFDRINHFMRSQTSYYTCLAIRAPVTEVMTTKEN
jgi:hypothetical protein